MKSVRTVIDRSDTAAALEHMCSRSAEVLLAEAEELLSAHLIASGGHHVRRVSADISREEQLCYPHFCAEIAGEAVDVYVVSICNMAAPAALSAAQYRYCEQQEGRVVCVLPCLVQRVRADKARCVALPLTVVRRKGIWAVEPEAVQYLPVAHRAAVGMDIPCAAWYLKRRNLVQEVANHGQRLYPLVKKFAHAGHLASGMEIRGSGTEAPLMLTLTDGREDGRLQLLYGGFYSSENAVNELLVADELTDDGQPLLRLKAVGGSEVCALCAEWQMFPEHTWKGERFRWSLSQLSCRMTMLSAGAYEPGYRGNELCAEVLRARRCNFCGLPLCHIEARAEGLIYNVYAAVYDPEAPLPEAGEKFCSVGTLFAVPDERLVLPESLPEVAEELLPLSLPVAVVAGGLRGIGYELTSPVKPIFRGGLPELRMVSPTGQRLLVLIDTVVNGCADCRGYVRYAPDFYPSHMDSVPPENLPAEVLFATVWLEGNSADGFGVKVIQHGAVKKEAKFVTSAKLPPAPELVEEDAVRIFGEMMVTHDFSQLLPLLGEDVCYGSETAGSTFHSKLDLLRHLRSCFDNWRSRNEFPNLSFLRSCVEYEGVRRPCMVACQHGEIISASVFDVVGGRITAISTLSGEVLDTLQHPEE